MAAGFTRFSSNGAPITHRIVALILICGLAALWGCSSSSDTESAVRNATTFSLIAKITSPLSGSTILLDADGTNENVNFTFTTSGGTAPYGYTFTVEGPNNYRSTSSGSAETTGSSTNLTFGSAGTYSVTLAIQDAVGNSATDRTTVILSTDPVAAAVFAQITSPSGNVSITAGDKVTFSGQGLNGSGTYSYAWNIPGGSTQSATTQSVSDVTFSTAGTYSITFRVTDSNGLTATDSVTVTVGAGKALTASITSPGSNISISTGGKVSFGGQGIGGTGTYSYAWSIPGGDTGSSNSQTVSNVTFNTAGTYTVTLTVTDSGGSSASDTVKVTVSKALTATITSPSADVSVTSGSPGPAKTLNLSASGSGGTGPYTYSWDIPGGSTTSSTSQALTVTFANPGKYLITLTVTDSTGATATATVTVTAT